MQEPQITTQQSIITVFQTSTGAPYLTPRIETLHNLSCLGPGSFPLLLLILAFLGWLLWKSACFCLRRQRSVRVQRGDHALSHSGGLHETILHPANINASLLDRFALVIKSLLPGLRSGQLLTGHTGTAKTDHLKPEKGTIMQSWINLSLSEDGISSSEVQDNTSPLFSAPTNYTIAGDLTVLHDSPPGTKAIIKGNLVLNASIPNAQPTTGLKAWLPWNRDSTPKQVLIDVTQSNLQPSQAEKEEKPPKTCQTEEVMPKSPLSFSTTTGANNSSSSSPSSSKNNPTSNPEKVISPKASRTMILSLAHLRNENAAQARELIHLRNENAAQARELISLKKKLAHYHQYDEQQERKEEIQQQQQFEISELKEVITFRDSRLDEQNELLQTWKDLVHTLTGGLREIRRENEELKESKFYFVSFSFSWRVCMIWCVGMVLLTWILFDIYRTQAATATETAAAAGSTTESS